MNKRWWGKHEQYWLGVSIAQSSDDCWTMQQIIQEVKPDFIVETGTFWVGSALYCGTILSQVYEAGKILTVDIDNHWLSYEATEHPLFKKMAECIVGDSVSDRITQMIGEKTKGRRVLVWLDSLHTKEHALKELRKYSNFVLVGVI